MIKKYAVIKDDEIVNIINAKEGFELEGFELEELTENFDIGAKRVNGKFQKKEKPQPLPYEPSEYSIIIEAMKDKFTEEEKAAARQRLIDKHG